MPEYSAYSQGNIIDPAKLDPGSELANQHPVLFINYGRLQDYEELFRNSAKKITRLTLEANKFVVIARYDKNAIAIVL